MHPTATTARVVPWPLSEFASRSASTESFLADSIKPQVFTTATSADSTSSTRVQPSAASRPASSSESTSLRAQPIVTMATVRDIGVMLSEGATNLFILAAQWCKLLTIESYIEPCWITEVDTNYFFALK